MKCDAHILALNLAGDSADDKWGFKGQGVPQEIAANSYPMPITKMSAVDR